MADHTVSARDGSEIFHSRESVLFSFFFSDSSLPLKGNQRDGGKEFMIAEGSRAEQTAV